LEVPTGPRLAAFPGVAALDLAALDFAVFDFATFALEGALRFTVVRGDFVLAGLRAIAVS
jgi:hypothetical protein